MLQQRELTNFLSVPSRSGARYFLKDGMQPYDVGDVFRQSDLANLLEVLSHKGVEEFYVGDIATQIDQDMRQNDGFLARRRPGADSVADCPPSLAAAIPHLRCRHDATTWIGQDFAPGPVNAEHP